MRLLRKRQDHLGPRWSHRSVSRCIAPRRLLSAQPRWSDQLPGSAREQSPKLQTTTNARTASGNTYSRSSTAPTRVASTRTRVTIHNTWTGSSFRGQNYTAFRAYHRVSHNRDWWRSRYNTIALVNGGYYYWYSGYWYPAWGYDLGFNSYPYDGPIYGYGNLQPGQVIINVQIALQQQGYYRGAVDGALGPMTRSAIANFQSDHGLAVTAAVDQPTLVTLGLI